MRRIGWIGPLLVFVTGLWQAPAMAEKTEQARVAFRVEVEREVHPDRMYLRLRAQAQADTPAAVQQAVNDAMQSAHRQLAGFEGISASTGQYRVHPVYRKERIVGWRGSQDMVLEGGDFARLAEAMGRLQSSGLAVQEVRYLVSAPLRHRIEGELVGEAVAAFRARARQLVDDFGAHGYRLIQADVSTSSQMPPVRPVMRAQFAEGTAATPPVLAPGTRRLSAAVRGTIGLDF